MFAAPKSFYERRIPLRVTKWNYNSWEGPLTYIQVVKSPHRLSLQTPPVQLLSFAAQHASIKQDLASLGRVPQSALSFAQREHIIYVNDPGCCNALALNKQEISLNKRTIEAARLSEFMIFVKSISSPNCNWRFHKFTQEAVWYKFCCLKTSKCIMSLPSVAL